MTERKTKKSQISSHNSNPVSSIDFLSLQFRMMHHAFDFRGAASELIW